MPLASGRCRSSASRSRRQRQRIGYVPQRESVDWDFPVSVLDVVLMGTYGRLGWFRRPGRGRARAGRAQCLDKVGMARLRPAGRSASSPAASSSGRSWPGPWPSRPTSTSWTSRWPASMRPPSGSIFELLQELREPGQDGPRRASRPADGAAVLRLRGPAQHAAGRQRADARRSFTPENLRKTYGGRLAILDAAGEARRAPRSAAAMMLTYNTLDRAGSASSLLGASAGLVGSFAVLRRRALTGDALAHAALPGLCLAFLHRRRAQPAGHARSARWPRGVLGIAIISVLRRWTRIKEDAAIGIVLSVFFGAGHRAQPADPEPIDDRAARRASTRTSSARRPA